MFLKEIVEQDVFQRSSSKLTMALGKDIEGMPYVLDLAKAPHVLVAGTTGSGKSVAVNSMVMSILLKATPEEVRFIMVDPKMLELSVYEGIPHLLLPVVTDPKKAALALRWAVEEMERRYQLLSEAGVRNIAGYNKLVESAKGDARVLLEKKREDAEAEEGRIAAGGRRGRGRVRGGGAGPGEGGVARRAVAARRRRGPAGRASSRMTEPRPSGEQPSRRRSEKPKELKKLPYMVVIIDELADLMMVASREVETSIARLAQMARAAGIHLLVATQRPSTDVVTGVIKANFPTRISFMLRSKPDSMTILGHGRRRVAARAWATCCSCRRPARTWCGCTAPTSARAEIKRAVDHLKAQGKPVYDETILRPREEDAGRRRRGGRAERRALRPGAGHGERDAPGQHLDAPAEDAHRLQPRGADDRAHGARRRRRARRTAPSRARSCSARWARCPAPARRKSSIRPQSPSAEPTAAARSGGLSFPSASSFAPALSRAQRSTIAEHPRGTRASPARLLLHAPHGIRGDVEAPPGEDATLVGRAALRPSLHRAAPELPVRPAHLPGDRRTGAAVHLTPGQRHPVVVDAESAAEGFAVAVGLRALLLDSFVRSQSPQSPRRNSSGLVTARTEPRAARLADARASLLQHPSDLI